MAEKNRPHWMTAVGA